MQYLGSLEETLSYVVSTPQSEARDRQDKTIEPDRSLQHFLSEKVTSLAHILTDIDREMKQRGGLSRALIGQIYQHYLDVKNKLLAVEHWPLGSNRMIDQRRSQLGETLDTLLREKRNEEVQCCQDIARLKIEFWRWFKQYSDEAQRVRLVLSK